MIKDHSDIPSLDKRVPGVPAIEPVIFPRLEALYARRSARLEELAFQLVKEAAQTEPSSAEAEEINAGYFSFLSGLVAAQGRLLAGSPLSLAEAEPIRVLLCGKNTSPDIPTQEMLEKSLYWQKAFSTFVDDAGAQLQAETQDALKALALEKPDVLATQAYSLLSGQYDQVDAGAAVFLWAALSAFWAQAIALLADEDKALKQRRSEGGACPCCGAPPSGALVLTGDREGLRYLQCSLCETRWHKVRATCSVCDATDHIDYWSFENTNAPIQAETCGDCKSYVKLFRLDRDPVLEVLADDLATVVLDAALEDQGFIRAALNPFALPA
ncbi:formate dehydrogenase accessory protein FdhE [Acetobacter cerevisiae]|uniref:Formate dehydrogenase accessory protein FdhE n=1 Tax=Acetobacter cerevisiae TaxID=178900 RepID=A0ABT1ET56_9PROT|nr:formate dehydrogenase accessory protein FdhE [Acetobacter cerevisiae]MCP1246562.1 formate dehydrogenase accessory protein FdhE [Acetobacter cerevisiae]MCP1256121.1 formate dehydrogenase accessory protein FdhE [Acetobacter cerevisiae]